MKNRPITTLAVLFLVVSLTRIFLLDRDDRVVLVGDPLSGEGLWNLYLETIDNLLAHDGLYVAE